MAGEGVRRFTPRLTRQTAPSGSEAFAQKVDENLLALQGISAGVSESIRNVQETVSNFSGDAPWLTNSVQYVSPDGNNLKTGKGWTTAVADVYTATKRICDEGVGGAVFIGKNSPLGGPANALRLRGDVEMTPPGWLQAVPLAFVGVGNMRNLNFNTPTAQVPILGGSTAGSQYRRNPAIWVSSYNTSELSFANLAPYETAVSGVLSYQGLLFQPVRVAMDYPYYLVGGVPAPLALPITGVSRPGDGTLVIDVSIPTTFAIQSAQRVGNVLTFTIPRVAGLAQPPWNILQPVYFNDTSGTFGSGAHTVLSAPWGVYGSKPDWSFSVSSVGADTAVISNPGSIAPQTMIVGGKLELESTDANVPATVYGVSSVAYTSSSTARIICPDPYGGMNGIPSTYTAGAIGAVLHEEFGYYNCVGPKFDNCQFAVPSDGSTLAADAVWKSGPPFIGGNGSATETTLTNCSFNGHSPPRAPVGSPPAINGYDEDRASAYFCAGPQGSIVLRTIRCRGTNVGLRIQGGGDGGSVIDIDFWADTGNNYSPALYHISAYPFDQVNITYELQADSLPGFGGPIIDGNPDPLLLTRGWEYLAQPTTFPSVGPLGMGIGRQGVWRAGTYKTPQETGEVGVFRDGWMNVRHPASYRALSPTSARFTNLAALPSGWLITNGTLTPGIADPNGGTGAFRITSTGADVECVVGIPSFTFAPGDWHVMAGMVNFGDPTKIVAASGFGYSTGTPGMLWQAMPGLGVSDGSTTWNKPWPQGNPGWHGVVGAVKYTGSGLTASPTAFITGATGGGHADYFGWVWFVIPASAGLGDADICEYINTIRPWPSDMPAGVAGTWPGQKFIARSGLGVDPSVLVVPTAGTPTLVKFEPRFAPDGTTVQGYGPLYDAPHPPPAGTVTGVAHTAPITDTGTATNPNIGVADFVGSGASHARGTVPDPGASAGTTKFLREDATWATPPTTALDHKVMVSATDPAPDYLDTKFESTTGNILISHILGPPEFVNINVDPALLGIGDIVTELVYYVEINSTVLATLVANGTSWIPMGSVTGFTPSVVEYPVAGPVATVAQMDIAVLANPLSGAGTLGFELTKNGGIGGSAIATISVGTGSAAFRTTGQFALSSIAATDTWGLAIAPVSAPSVGGSTFRASVRIRLATQAW